MRNPCQHVAKRKLKQVKQEKECGEPLFNPFLDLFTPDSFPPSVTSRILKQR